MNFYIQKNQVRSGRSTTWCTGAAMKHLSVKTAFLAIAILSDICYWYKPTFEYDETSGEIVSKHKKFASDLLQKSGRYEDAIALMENTQKLHATPSRSYALGMLYQKTGQHRRIERRRRFYAT